MLFGSLSFDIKKSNVEGRVISTKLVFKGDNFHKRIEERKQRKYINIGSMNLECNSPVLLLGTPLL
jgi:hypothetical protein